MPNVNDIFPNKSRLTVENVDETGPQTRTITSAETEEVEFNGEVSTRVVCHLEPFGDMPCRMNLTAAGARSLGGVLDSFELGDWSDRTIEIYVADVQGFGRTHRVLRARSAGAPRG
jgi:hypothetical protein